MDRRPRRHLAWIVLFIEDYGGDRFQGAFRTRKQAEAYVSERCSDGMRCYYAYECWDLDVNAECGYEDGDG